MPIGDYPPTYYPPTYSVKDDPNVGIIPDYDSHIPIARAYSPEILVEKLNKEILPWDKERGEFSITQTSSWRWEIDFVQFAPTPYQLFRGTNSLGYLERKFAENDALDTVPQFTDLNVYGSATVDDIRFIRECTGWTINV